MKFSEAALQEAFLRLEAAATDGLRCPTNDQFTNSGVIGALARAGKIRVEVSMKNFRQVFILTGPHAGKSTAPPPSHKDGTRPKPYVVVTVKGTFRNGRAVERISKFRPRPTLRDYSGGY